MRRAVENDTLTVGAGASGSCAASCRIHPASAASDSGGESATKLGGADGMSNRGGNVLTWIMLSGGQTNEEQAHVVWTTSNGNHEWREKQSNNDGVSTIPRGGSSWGVGFPCPRNVLENCSADDQWASSLEKLDPREQVSNKGHKGPQFRKRVNTCSANSRGYSRGTF